MPGRPPRSDSKQVIEFLHANGDRMTLQEMANRVGYSTEMTRLLCDNHQVSRPFRNLSTAMEEIRRLHSKIEELQITKVDETEITR